MFSAGKGEEEGEGSYLLSGFGRLTDALNRLPNQFNKFVKSRGKSNIIPIVQKIHLRDSERQIKTVFIFIEFG